MNLLRYLLFFPSATFSIYTAEVFPYGILYALTVIRKISIYLILIFIFFGFSIIYGIYRYGVIDYFEILRSLFAYLNPLLVFYVLCKVSGSVIDKFDKILKKLFIFFVILGILQLSGILSPLNFIFDFIVPRASSTSLGFRGVTLISTEPARAGIELLFIYFYIRRFHIKPGNRIFSDILAFIYVIFVFKSASVLFVYLLFIALIYYRKSIVFIPIISTAAVLTISFSDGRAAVLIRDIFSLPFEDAIWLITNTSGNRVISIYSSLNYGLHNFFGGGIGAWKHSSVEALNLTGINYSDLNYFRNALAERGGYFFRSSGYFMNLLMDTGYIGCLAVFSFIYRTTRIIRKKRQILNKDDTPFYLVFIFNILIVGSVGAPVPWVVTALYLRHYIKNKSDRKI